MSKIKTELAIIKKGLDYNYPILLSVIYFCYGKARLINLNRMNLELISRSTNAELIIVCCEDENEKFPDEIIKDMELFDLRLKPLVIKCNNIGATAKNLGYVMAQGKYIISIDDDVAFNNDCLEIYLKYLIISESKNINIGIIGVCGALMNFDKWNENDWITENFGWGKDGLFFGYDIDLTGQKVHTIPSLFWGFKKSLLDDIGYLSSEFAPFIGSDSDLCFRAILKGYENHIVRAPIYHLGGGGQSHQFLPCNRDELDRLHKRRLYEKYYEKLKAVKL